MNYLLLVVGISILILFIYCYYGQTQRETFLKSPPNYTAIHVAQGTGKTLQENEQIIKNASIGTSTTYSGAQRKLDIPVPCLSNPISRQQMNCQNNVYSCDELGEESTMECALCYDDNLLKPLNGYLKTDKRLPKFNDCPCFFTNKSDCKNYKLIRECKKIKNPYDLAVSMYDCGFVFTDLAGNGKKRDTDRGIHLDDKIPVSVSTSCAEANNSVNPKHIIMPKMSQIADDLNTTIVDKRTLIANWIKTKFNGKSDYTNDCQPELNNNGQLVSLDCMKQIFRAVGGTKRGRLNPTVNNYTSIRDKTGHKTVDGFENYMKELQLISSKTKNTRGNYTTEQLINAKLDLIGVLECDLADNIELTQENSDYISSCYKKEFNKTICQREPNPVYPTNPDDTLRLYQNPSTKLPNFNGKNLGDFKRFIKNIESRLANARENPNLYYENDTKEAYNYCFNTNYDISNLTGGTFGKMQQGFDVMTFKMEKRIFGEGFIPGYTDINTKDYIVNKLINYVTLPTINIMPFNMTKQLRNTVYQDGTPVVDDGKSFIRTHIQGALHFTKPGNYYFRVYHNGGVTFIVDTGIETKNILDLPHMLYDSKNGIHAYGVLNNVGKNSVFPFNITNETGSYKLEMRLEYFYSETPITRQSYNQLSWKLLNGEEIRDELPELRAVRIENLTDVTEISFISNDNGYRGPYWGRPLPPIIINNTKKMKEIIQIKDEQTRNNEKIKYLDTYRLKNTPPQLEITKFEKGLYTSIGYTLAKYKAKHIVYYGNPNINKPRTNVYSNSIWYIGNKYLENVAKDLLSITHKYKNEPIQNVNFHLKNIAKTTIKLKNPLDIDSVTVLNPKGRDEKEFRNNGDYYVLTTKRQINNSNISINIILPLYKSNYYNYPIGSQKSIISKSRYLFNLYPTAQSYSKFPFPPSHTYQHAGNFGPVINF